MIAAPSRIAERDKIWRLELSLREVRDALERWERQGWDVNIGSHVRWAVLNHTANRLTKLGIVCLVRDAARLAVL
jgi:hypothetical protein